VESRDLKEAANEAGKLKNKRSLKNLKLTEHLQSWFLKRAIKNCSTICVEEIPINFGPEVKTWRLNETSTNGALQGLE